MAHELDLTEPPTAAEHRTTTVEQGRFVTARCSCGWRGAARRARSKARSDAEGHRTGPLR
ncbi:hypothetical protein ACFV0R_11945 [Streptomyces sp. NPDC059578]|uniref:hypothetical protein n=1 Tax=unclassified Streptomyces TaxID=2593676 RepID=UPI00365D7ABC